MFVGKMVELFKVVKNSTREVPMKRNAVCVFFFECLRRLKKLGVFFCGFGGFGGWFLPLVVLKYGGFRVD